MSGELVWQFALRDGARPVVENSVVYIANLHSIDALDLKTGELLWQVEVDSGYEYEYYSD